MLEFETPLPADMTALVGVIEEGIARRAMARPRR